MPPLATLIAPLRVAPLMIRSRELATARQVERAGEGDAVEDVAAAAGGLEHAGATGGDDHAVDGDAVLHHDAAGSGDDLAAGVV